MKLTYPFESQLQSRLSEDTHNRISRTQNFDYIWVKVERLWDPATLQLRIQDTLCGISES
ncbi:hypothetical protein M413DRAFT_443490 [Hebeloma cylindrosporum]|uniref:Uncharacterized protein n=1 Tax=Hebeloma cylindrosporum TaxID=76867 RepID=A0A0C3C3W0_HEBCY|nr:hypothetical protein M413DRAFT_443490 [Hebeloma cylindrosporum h7]